MPGREELEFQHQHGPVRIRRQTRVVIAKSTSALYTFRAFVDNRLNRPQVLISFALEKRKEKILLPCEVGVESAPRMPGIFGDVLQPGGLEAHLCENLFG